MLNGRKRKIKLRDFDALAVVLGIPLKVVSNTYRKFQSLDKSVFELIETSFLNGQLKTLYAKAWGEKQIIVLRKAQD